MIITIATLAKMVTQPHNNMYTHVLKINPNFFKKKLTKKKRKEKYKQILNSTASCLAH